MLISSTNNKAKISCDQFNYRVLIDGFKYSFVGSFRSNEDSSEDGCQTILHNTRIPKFFEQEKEQLDTSALYLRKRETGGFQNSKIRIEITGMKSTENLQI